MITKICSTCQKEIYRSVSEVNRNKSGNFFCSSECMSISYTKTVEFNCFNCKKVILRPPSWAQSNKLYCSSSCSAIENNKHQKEKKTKTCKKCKKLITSSRSYCDVCYIAKHYLSNKTLSEAIQKRIDSNRYTGIRGNARLVFKLSGKPRQCAYCNYDKHIEVCHIKEIASFSMDTKIHVINNINNIIALCPNHHWELDHDMLTIDKIMERVRLENITKVG